MKVAIDTVLKKFEVDNDYLLDYCNVDTLAAEIELCNDKYCLEFTALYSYNQFEGTTDEYGRVEQLAEAEVIEILDAELILMDEEGTYRQIEIEL